MPAIYNSNAARGIAFNTMDSQSMLCRSSFSFGTGTVSDERESFSINIQGTKFVLYLELELL